MLKYWRKFPEGEVDVYSEYKKNSALANNSDNPCNGKYPKKIQTEHGESIIRWNNRAYDQCTCSDY
ncbi:hypothetical protein F030043B2_02800 [Bacteroides fragilis]